MNKVLYIILSLLLFSLTIISCSPDDTEKVNKPISKAGDTVNGVLDPVGDGVNDGLDSVGDVVNGGLGVTTGSGGISSSSCSFKNTKALIVGNAVTEKCIFYDCPKSKIVIWDLNGCMKVVGESVLGAVDAAFHNNSIYIADDAGYYWIAGPETIEKKKINNSSGYKLSEITGISVNSTGNVYVAGNVLKNKKSYTAYWKNGELVKAFRENADWYSEKHVAADSKGNVYIPGWRMKSHEVTYSALWINGTRKNLSTSHDGEATDVVIGSETASGTNVWISGAYGPYTLGGNLAAYWRRNPNGQTSQTRVTKVKTYGLPINHVNSSRASSIFVSGSTVYMAGAVNVVNAGDVPVYWKGKTQNELPVEFNLKTCDYCKADPTDISLLDSKPLVVGDYYNEKDFVDGNRTNGETKAVYWHNKKLHKLCECCGTSRAVTVLANECGGTSCEQAEWEDQTCLTSSSGTKDNKAFTKQLGSSGEDVAIEVAVDSSGNSYVTGYTDGGLDGNSSSGKKDFFLIKYNSSGTKEWTKQEGSSGDDYAYGLAVDSSDNIYVTGYTDKKLHGNNSSGRFDMFLVKYNSSGARQWTKQLGTSNNEYASAVETDSSDNIYVTGMTWGGLDGSTKPRYCMGYGTVKASRECTDIFLVKYNSSGTKQWVKQLEGSSKSFDNAQGLAVDSSDNIYVAGFTNGGLDGNTSSGGYDILLVKYNSGGSKQWLQQFGSSKNDMGLEVNVDSKGNIYVTGYTQGGLDGKTYSGEKDIFLVKYNSSGTKQWTQQLGTPTFEEGNGVAVDSSDNIYVSGWTRGKLDTYAGGDDAIVLKYNSSGTKQWTLQFGAPSFLEKSRYNSGSQMTTSEDKGVGVAVDSSGNIYVTGNTKGGLDGNTNSGKKDIFLVKYNSM
jgi:uncharacterized delta-60 repeat protein